MALRTAPMLPRKRDKECGAYDYGQHHRLDVNGRSKYRLPNAMGQHRAGKKSNQGTGQARAVRLQ